MRVDEVGPYRVHDLPRVGGQAASVRDLGIGGRQVLPTDGFHVGHRGALLLAQALAFALMDPAALVRLRLRLGPGLGGALQRIGQAVGLLLRQQDAPLAVLGEVQARADDVNQHHDLVV